MSGASAKARALAAGCPCGTGRTYSKCCRPLHLRHELPVTAEQLMRSRYSAYAKRLGAYLLYSWHPETRPESIEFDVRHRWTGLTVMATEAGGPHDDVGVVEFVATFEVDRGAGIQRSELHEISEFVRFGADESGGEVGGQSGGEVGGESRGEQGRGRWLYLAEREH